MKINDVNSVFSALFLYNMARSTWYFKKTTLIIIVSIWNYEMKWEAFLSDECPFLNVRTRDVAIEM